MSELPINQVVCGDCREIMRGWPAESINFVMFSPPYWGLRNYGENVNTVWGGDPSCEHDFQVRERKTTQGGNLGATAQVGATKAGVQREIIEEGFCSKCGAWRGQLGLEPDYRMYVEHMVEVGREIKRILRKDGSWYLNLGDTYAGSKSHSDWTSPRNDVQVWLGKKKLINRYEQKREMGNIPAKCKLLMPYRVALALIDDGWTVRNDITWYKSNAMPSSVKDRLTCQTERIFHLVKSRKYFYDLDAIRVPHSTNSIKRASYAKHGEGDFYEDGRVSFSLARSVKEPQKGGVYTKGRGVVPFNLRVRDVKRGKFGTTAQEGRLRASKEEVESYRYPEKIRPEGIGPSSGQRAGYPKKLAENIYHPVGKNPGDVIRGTPQAPPHHAVRFRPSDFGAESLGYTAGYYPEGKNPGDFWSITTRPFPQAHFAVYPETLCERPIKSSCPAQVCRKCGRPRERINKRVAEVVNQWGVRRKKPWFNDPREMPQKIIKEGIYETTGWTDCGCGAGFEPGIVLDPMCGSGTTLIVAKKLGRRYIGIDLNRDYVEMARRRLDQVEWPLEARS